MKPSEFASVMLSCRDILHIAHLKTTSYAAHVALGGLYDAMLDHFDSFVEIVQTDGLLEIKGFSVTPVKPEDIVEYLEDDFLTVVQEMKDDYASDMSKNGHLVNLLEDIVSDTKHGIYKLKFLQ